MDQLVEIIKVFLDIIIHYNLHIVYNLPTLRWLFFRFLAHQLVKKFDV